MQPVSGAVVSRVVGKRLHDCRGLPRYSAVAAATATSLAGVVVRHRREGGGLQRGKDMAGRGGGLVHLT